MKTILFVLLLFPSINYVGWSNDFNLEECQTLAIKNNPAIRPFENELNSQDGLIEQAGLSPNPELEFEAENFLGSGDFQGVDGIETTLGLSQTIETAGKLNNRITLASNQKQLIVDRLKITKLNILYQTTDAYFNTLFTQERLNVERSFFDISQKTFETIRSSVEAGRDSPLEEIRAKVMVSSSQISMGRIQKQHDKNRIILASYWGSVTPSFNGIDGSLLPIPEISDIESKLSLMQNHPEMEKANNEIRVQESFFDLQQSHKKPNFTISAGVRYLSEVDDGAFVIGFSVPLPLRNRNQGAIRAAKEKIEYSAKEQEKIEFELQSQLHQSYVEYEQSYQEVNRLQTDILPNAKMAFDSALEGYRQGKFPYLTVLDAQRSLFDLEVQELESALEVHQSINKINYLTANYKILNTQNEED